MEYTRAQQPQHGFKFPAINEVYSYARFELQGLNIDDNDVMR